MRWSQAACVGGGGVGGRPSAPQLIHSHPQALTHALARVTRFTGKSEGNYDITIKCAFMQGVRESCMILQTQELQGLFGDFLDAKNNKRGIRTNGRDTNQQTKM